MRFQTLAAAFLTTLLGWSDSQAQVSQPETTTNQAFPVSIRIDASASRGELQPIWRFFGYDEPNFTYQPNGKKLLIELSALPGPINIRTHHLLTSGDGTAALKWGSTGVYSEDPSGSPIYRWEVLDRIFDTFNDLQLKPFVEIGFMPEALSVHPQDYPHDPPAHKMVSPGLGFSYPPKDYKKWEDLCFAWATHSLARYGQKTVDQWRWEVWNEPNIFYWKGTPEEYFKLYDYATAGVRRALPHARVGGPDTAGGPGGHFLHDFLEHCLHGTNNATGEKGSPLDFVAFHAKGSPVFQNGHVRMGMANQLQNINDGFATVAAFPELKKIPIIIGECDPEGCAACQGPQLGYRNSTMYSSYTAASFAAALDLADKHGVNFQGALTWAFEFENQPYFAGFRALASNGIDLPVLNTFRMFAKMGGARLSVASSADPGADTVREKSVRGSPLVSALASLDHNKFVVLVWHYHDDDVQGPEAAVELSTSGLPWKDGAARAQQYRIDESHSNAFEFWKRLGSPNEPTLEQYRQLEKAAQLALLETRNVRIQNGKTTWRLNLPRRAVSLFVIEPL
jgi:xylan 1,4-beta-xylosidase